MLRANEVVAAVRRLDLTDFRNYRSLRLDVEPAPVVLTGANGAGKTNLLEALSFWPQDGVCDRLPWVMSGGP